LTLSAKFTHFDPLIREIKFREKGNGEGKAQDDEKYVLIAFEERRFLTSCTNHIWNDGLRNQNLPVKPRFVMYIYIILNKVM